MKKQLLIIGGGFAGFWSAISAIRQSREIGKTEEIEVTVVNTDDFFTIRPRLYEVSLEGLRVELDKYFKPLGIRRIAGRAENIRPSMNEVTVATAHGVRTLHYDYLILATGGSLKAVDLPGIELTHNVDTFDNAQRLEDHLIALAKDDFSTAGAATFVVSGAGFTGLEAVTSIEEKAQAIQERYSKKKTDFKVVLIDRGEKLAAAFSPEGQKYIAAALAQKNIEVITGTQITAIAPTSIQLSTGRQIATQTVIWTVGMVASTLTQCFQGDRDALNRLSVDGFLKLPGYKNVIIAGDVANVSVDDGRPAVMACQYSQFQGRWAGHNAVNDLFAEPLKEYIQNGYVTCIDLGVDHGLYTTGWERTVAKSGTEARSIKNWVNTILIYPMAELDETLKASYPEIPSF